jgi:hypothetical protein
VLGWVVGFNYYSIHDLQTCINKRRFPCCCRTVEINGRLRDRVGKVQKVGGLGQWVEIDGWVGGCVCEREKEEK